MKTTIQKILTVLAALLFLGLAESFLYYPYHVFHSFFFVIALCHNGYRRDGVAFLDIKTC